MVSVAERFELGVDPGVLDEARRIVDLDDSATVVVRDSCGESVALPDEVQGVLLSALRAVLEGKRLTIAEVPSVLSSTVAADLLGVSRPTLLKLASEGQVPSFKAGTHTRFQRDEILAFKRRRRAAQRSALDELRKFDEDAGLDS